MNRAEIETWDGARWDAEIMPLLELAREKVRAMPEGQEVLLVKTMEDNVYLFQDNMDMLTGDYSALEAHIQTLLNNQDTEVFCCFTLFSDARDAQPNIPCWYFNQRLIEINPKNMDAEVLLWCGEEDYSVKPLKVLLPPKKDASV